MTGFETYVNDLFNERGINEYDKKDLEFEITDHLVLLKKEYLVKGLSEEEAIKLAIKEFGECNFIGNSIKRNLPSHNKTVDLSMRERINCLIEMFLIYFVLKFLWDLFLHSDSESMFFYFGMIIPVILTSFIFINKKLRNVKNKILNIVFCNAVFFILEKIAISCYVILRLTILDERSFSIYLLNSVKSSYIFNSTYILIFLLSTLCSIMFTKILENILLKNIRNNYNLSIKSIVILSISIVLILIYTFVLTAYPYRLNEMGYIITNFTGLHFDSINMNLAYIIIGNKLIIPNIGLLILLILFIRLVIQIRKKGIKSIL